MSPNIVLYPTHGLANRLRAIASAHILAEHLGSRFHMRWRPEDACNCTFEDLFETPVGANDGANDGAKPILYVPNTHTSTLLQERGDECRAAGTLLISGGHEFKHPDMSEDTFVARKRAFYASLRPTAAVRAIVDRWGDPSDAVAVHFRDFVPRFDQADGRVFHEVSPMGDFVDLCRVIASKRPRTRFAVFTNTDRAREALHRALPAARPTPALPPDTGRDHTEGVRRALAEMLVMSRCRMIVGTDMSSFSDEACFFGGTPKLCMALTTTAPYHCHGTARYLGQRFVMLDRERVRDVFAV